MPHREPVAAPPAKTAPEWLLLVAWRQKWLIAATVVLAGIGALLYVKTARPIYASTARIYVQQTGSHLGGSNAGQPSSENFRQTQKELIPSEPVLTIAAAALDPLPKGEAGKPAKVDPFHKPALKTLEGPNKTIDQLKAVIATDVDKSTDIISVTAYSPYREEASQIANAMVDAYMAYQTKPKQTNLGETLGVLDQKKKEAESDLAKKVEELHGMEQKYGLLNQRDERANLILRQLQSLSDALIDARRETINARTSFEEAKRSLGPKAAEMLENDGTLDDPEMDMMDASPEHLAALRSQILQVQVLLQELQQRYLPHHPAILKLKASLLGLNRQYVRAIGLRYLSAQNREKEFQQQYNTAQQTAIGMSAEAAIYARIQEDADRLKKVRDELDSRIRQLAVDSSTGVQVDVVERARAELKPYSPRRSKVYPIAMAVGLMAGLMLACLREWVDDRFHSAGEMRTSLGMPLLAVIPQSATKRSLSVSGQRILLDPASDAAEAYRSLRTAVQFAAPEGQVRTLLVTSPKIGDGKTTLVSNLGIALAQGGKRVIIVDADLRKPMQQEIFGVKGNTGLSMLLAGRCSLDTAVQRGSVPNLDVLPCGPTPANPSEILNSHEFGEVLEQLAEKYDYVLLDSSSVQASSDCRIIAALCDATLIVLKAQTAHRRATEQTRDALLGVGAKIIGLVVNDVPRRAVGGYSHTPPAQRRYVPGLTSQEYDILQARAK